MLAIAANWARGLYAEYRWYPGLSEADSMVPADEGERLALAGAVPWDVPEDLARTSARGQVIVWERTADGFMNGIGRALDDAIKARFEPYPG